MKTIALMVVTAVFAAAPATRSTDDARGVGPASKNIHAKGAAALQGRADPADSLYRLAREALSRGDYNRASEIFSRVVDRYPSSSVAGESLYYAAFAMYRAGGTEKLKAAREALERLTDSYPDVAKKGDAKTLRTRVCGELAKRGDEECAAEVAEQADPVARPVPAARAQPAQRATPATPVAPRAGNCPSENDEDDERIAALNALLQMDAARAMPILTKVLERRDACSAALRRKAVFLVSQKRTPETADLLLRIARNDPDNEVREQAVFWLSQVSDERAVDMLQDILRNSKEENLQNKALFALSQHRSGRGAAILREFAARDGASDELRGQAIFWLGQRKAAENSEFLRNLYTRLRNQELKDKILFSLSQQRGMGNEKWLMDIATSSAETVELRKKALFWAGQSNAVPLDQLVSLYARMPDREMKDQMIFVLSQKNTPAAVDKLLDIAKNDRDPELRKKAIFWLGQSRDPRIQQFLLDLINR